MIQITLTPDAYYSPAGVGITFAQATYDAVDGVQPIAGGFTFTLDLLPLVTASPTNPAVVALSL